MVGVAVCSAHDCRRIVERAVVGERVTELGQNQGPQHGHPDLERIDLISRGIDEGDARRGVRGQQDAAAPSRFRTGSLKKGWRAVLRLRIGDEHRPSIPHRAGTVSRGDRIGPHLDLGEIVEVADRLGLHAIAPQACRGQQCDSPARRSGGEASVSKRRKKRFKHLVSDLLCERLKGRRH
jgi:hypothetical protein